MAENTQEHGRKTKCMVKASTAGLMVSNTKASILKTERKDKVFSLGKTDENTMVVG